MVGQKSGRYGVRKPPNDLCKNVQEALRWDAPDEPEFGRSRRTKKNFDQVTQIQMERSPQKWKTSYKDQFRKFRDSPARGASGEEQNEEENGEEMEAQQMNQDLRAEPESQYATFNDNVEEMGAGVHQRIDSNKYEQREREPASHKKQVKIKY